MDVMLFKAKLAAALDYLADAGREAGAASATAALGAQASLRRAAFTVDELIRLCDGEHVGRPCPACAKTVMAAATLCGYCWTKLTPMPR